MARFFDASGAVMGMLLPDNSDSDRTLPAGVSFAADSTAISQFLASQGVETAQLISASSIAPEDLTMLAGDMTVLVSCWN